MRLTRLLLSYVAREKWRFAAALALALVGVAFQVASPWPLKIVVDYAIGGRPLPARLAAVAAWLPDTRSASGLLVWAVAIGVVCAAGRAVIELVVRVVMMRVAQRIVLDLQQQVFAKLQRLSLAFHGRHLVGDLAQRVSADVFVVQAVLSAAALPAVVSFLGLVGMLVIMAKLDATLTLVAAGMFPVLGVSLAVFGSPMRRTAQQQWRQQGAMMAFVEQSLSAVRVIQGFARERYVQRALDLRARDLGRAYSDSLLVGGGYNQLNTATTGMAAAVVLGVGGARVLAGSLTVGDLLVFLGYVAALFAPAVALATAIGTGVSAVPRARRVFEVLDSTDELPERPRAARLDRVRGQVVFDAVTFGYCAPGTGVRGRAVLRDVSFRAEPGQVTAIVGATGAGKSSLVSLLSRFYDPWEGVVRIDGHDVRELTLQSLRENVSLVLQEPFLFPMTVAENIAFGRPDAVREEIVEAAKMARAHDFVARLPEGYDTLIGEKGSTLSGGERQRIAIARALLKDAPILVLDEPTSALDAHTERQIFSALSDLMHRRTTFIISHRLSTIRRADVILALEDGRIAERGTHESLLAKESVYANLYKHQHLAAL